VAVLFLLYLASRKRSSALPSRAGVRLLSNGTTTFRPTTIVVSLDGFRADYLTRGDTPTLNAFIAEGVSPKYMRPSFPSVTFPNHYTMVTGLYPESHGIVGNSFWDPRLHDKFHYTNASSSLQAKWWGGEPLWATAQLQGVRTAVHMWPGSEAHIGPVEPSIVDPYNGSEVLSRKVQRILGFLDLPGPNEAAAATAAAAVTEERRPQLILAYVPDVDSAGHEYGPNSTQIHATLRRVDDMLRDLLAGLQQRNLTHVVNIVVVSDHGMATTSTGRLLQLEDLLDPALLAHTDGWPLYGLRPKRDADLQPLYERLVARAAAQHPAAFDVYLRDGNMPVRYHFARNERIAPLWIVPRTGWAIVAKKEFDVRRGRENGEIYHPRGLHGYDNEDPLMRAIFIARGPAFPHRPNSKLPVFRK
jgi:predicted AlkP superfamily pyrophosphatase or phosphodiesterase